jgi:hypothetical protein
MTDVAPVRARSRRVQSVIAAGALVLLTHSGCVTLVDRLGVLGGPNSQLAEPGTSLPVRSGDSARAVKLDRQHGLVCTTVDSPVVRGTSRETKSVDPNGVKTLVILAESFEGGLVGLALWKGDAPFRRPYFVVPAGLDLAWGLYRAITIKPTIVRETIVRVEDDDSTRTVSFETPCPPGTEVAVEGDGVVETLRIGSDGRLDEVALPTLIAFLRAHAAISAVGAGVRFDGSAAADLLSAAQRRDAEARAQVESEAARRLREAPGPPPPPPPPPPMSGRVIIRVDASGVTRVYGVIVDFPSAALCAAGSFCPAGQHCADRGDGVPLCFGSGAIHPFCATAADCARGVCLRRPDSVGVCQ